MPECQGRNVGSGSIASFWRPAVNFRSTPANGHTTDPYLGSAPCPLRKHRDDREVGKLPPVGAAPIRRRAHILGFWRVVGSDIIVPRRNNSAHLHRPWRAKLPPFRTKQRTPRMPVGRTDSIDLWRWSVFRSPAQSSRSFRFDCRHALCRRAALRCCAFCQARGRTYAVGAASPVKVREALAAGC